MSLGLQIFFIVLGFAFFAHGFPNFITINKNTYNTSNNKEGE